jgi:hypothetical protein
MRDDASAAIPAKEKASSVTVYFLSGEEEGK